VLCCLSVPEKVEVEPWEESVLLPFKVPHRLWFCKYRLSVAKVEWRNVRDNRKVHVYQNGSDQPGEQDEFYRTRTRMDENLLKTGLLSLILRRPTDGDENLYSCSVYNRKGDVLMEKQVWLKVKVPEQVKVESGVKSVLLPCRTTESLDGDTKVEWVDKYDRTVHVYQNGSNQPGEQHQYYRTRTKMDENLLKTKDLSLTLTCPTYEDRGIFTCRVSRDRVILMVKQVNLWVKAQDQVEVESGEESVLLPCRTPESLPGDVRVEWRDSRDRKVHVYQNGSDQPGEQDQFYRTRTKMDENLLENKDLSLTLRRPRERDSNTYICRVYSGDRNVLMEKDIQLQVKGQ
uniref:Ig-like domain-containing protein n=1 Tax=Poecilia formosa TaxID=48698 RepID=A0A087Y813_POEFO